MLIIYGIKNCDSVKKALKFFSHNNIPYTFNDFDSYSIDKNRLKEWASKSNIATLFNAKSTTFRTLGLNANELTDEEKIGWMEKENRLIKRPVIEYGSQVLIGFNISQYEGTFLS